MRRLAERFRGPIQGFTRAISVSVQHCLNVTQDFLSFIEYSEHNYEDETPKTLNSSIIENISQINISCIYIWWLVTEENYLLLKAILSSSNIKLYLLTIKVTLNNLKDALDILEILSEYKYLESVDLQYVFLEGMYKFYKLAIIKYW